MSSERLQAQITGSTSEGVAHLIHHEEIGGPGEYELSALAAQMIIYMIHVDYHPSEDHDKDGGTVPSHRSTNAAIGQSRGNLSPSPANFGE